MAGRNEVIFSIRAIDSTDQTNPFDLLRRHGIRTLVAIRSIPGSRGSPQYEQSTYEARSSRKGLLTSSPPPPVTTSGGALPGPLGGPQVAMDVNTLVGRPAPPFALSDSGGLGFPAAQVEGPGRCSSSIWASLETCACSSYVSCKVSRCAPTQG
jgi:hypothetical protein